MEISFKACLPAVHGAIDVHGMDGVRIKLDVAEDSLPQALKLVMLKGQVLDVTIRGEGEPIEVPKAAKRADERFTPSQRLRQVIWSEWSVEQQGEFEAFYRTRMGGIIEKVETGEL
jgi:hypothetical protein